MLSSFYIRSMFAVFYCAALCIINWSTDGLIEGLVMIAIKTMSKLNTQYQW